MNSTTENQRQTSFKIKPFFPSTKVHTKQTTNFINRYDAEGNHILKTEGFDSKIGNSTSFPTLPSFNYNKTQVFQQMYLYNMDQKE